MKRLIIIAAALAALMTAGPAGAATLIDRIVAIVGNDVVTQSELDVEMAPQLMDMQQRLRGDELEQASRTLRRLTLDRLIDKKLQLQEAVMQGITVTDEELDLAIKDIKGRNKMDDAQFEAALANEGYTQSEYKQSLKEQLMLIRLVNMAVKSKVLLEESEVRAYYDEHRSEYETEDSVTVANIFFPAKKGDMAGALEAARTAKAEIDGGASFEDMAVKCTGDPGAAESCVLGTFGQGQLSKEVESAAFGMRTGEVSEPIELTNGYQLIKVTGRTDKGSRGFDEVRGEITEELTVMKGESIFAKWIQELRDRAYVEVRD